MSSFGHGYEPSGSLLGNQQVEYFYNDDFDIFGWYNSFSIALQQLILVYLVVEDDETFLEFCHSLEFDPFETKTDDSSSE